MFKTRQLALKYKRNADEMRRKKFGIEPPPYNCLEDTNYSSAISSTKNESRETPNFSINISRRELNSEEDIPPMPIEQRPQQTLQAPPTMETEVLYEEINFVDQTSTAPTAITTRVDPEQAIGTIVKNQTLNSYRDNSRGSSFQPGMIIRQRSSSPAQSIQLTNLAHKLKDVGPTKHQNQSVQIGQIIRNSSAQQLIISQSLPDFNFKNVVSQTSPEHSTQFSKTHSLYHESPTDAPPSLRNSEAFTSNSYTILWEILNDNHASQKLSLINDQSHSIRTNLLKILSNPRQPQQIKLKQLRASLPNLILSSINDLSNSYLLIRSKLLERKVDLAQSLRTAGNELKSELLRDIVSRLTQKLTLNFLRLNSSLKSLMNLTFQTYYLTYIASDILHGSLSKLKSFTLLNQQKTQYFSDIKKQLNLNKAHRLLNVLKNIRPIREEAQRKKYEQFNIIDQHVKHRVLRAWHTGVLEAQCQQIRDQMVKEHELHRLRRRLFIHWVYGRRQSNKIKRMALLRVTSQAEGILKGDEEWKRNAEVRERDRFKERINEIFGEIQRIKEIIIKIKSAKNLKKESQKGIIKKQRVKDDQREVFVRRSMDVEIKYSIHQALVEQQNRQSNNGNSGSREIIRQIQPPSLRRCDSAQIIIPSRLMMTQTHGRHLSPAPINNIFKKLDTKKQKAHPISTFDPTSLLSLQDQLNENYKNSAKHIQTYPRLHHYIASLRTTAQDVMNKEAFSSVTDYIQYGISSEQSRIKFKQMFQMRVQSTLFQQWRKRYLDRMSHKILLDMHRVNFVKQSLIEWQRVVLSRKLRVKEFQRTMQIQRFYSLFQKWAKWNRQEVYLEIKQVKLFKKKTLFNAWTKYLEKQGNLLIKVIRSQNYYKQALLSKGMLGLYQFYLNQLRAKRFRRYNCFRKFFKFTWISQFKKQSSLRKILSKQINKVQTNERQKYQREFELKSDTLKQWKDNISSHQQEIQIISAQTHYRYQIIAKTFFQLKKLYSFTKSVSKLQCLFNSLSLKPSFEVLSSYSNTLKNSQMQFSQYRSTLAQTKIFLAWKEVSFQSKLSTLFFKKRYLRALFIYVHTRNNILPLQYRQTKLKHAFLATLHSSVRTKWNEKRSDIILRQLRRKQRERQMKLVIMRFVENAIESRRMRQVEDSARDYQRQTLAQKAFRVLKRRWLKQKKRRLMNQVAREFKGQRREKRQEELRESVISNASDFDIVRLRDHKVFQDPAQMIKYRVVSSWKMFLQDKMRRETVLDRFLIYKKRMLSLRCFLSWRSIAKYEQSTGVCTSIYQSTQRQIKLGSRETSREQTKRIEPTHSVKFSLDTRQYPYDPKTNLMNVTIGSQDSIAQPGHGALATFGQRSIASNYDLSHQKPNPIPSESPNILRQSEQQLGTGSLFEELETIFQKNRKWLDEQREREEFLKEMASHYNQRLSLEMSTLRFSQEQNPSLATNSLASRK